MPNILQSSNGYPASADQAEIGIKSYKVPGTDLKLRAAESIAPLLIGFASEFHAIIEPIDSGTLDDWGYAFRDVRGVPGMLSNHSSGTAIDLNALRHPLGKLNTFSAEKVPMLDALVRKYGLRAGKDYKGRQDPMHFEINLNAAKAAALIKKIQGENK